jgi:hypothetical protein
MLFLSVDDVARLLYHIHRVISSGICTLRSHDHRVAKDIRFFMEPIGSTYSQPFPSVQGAGELRKTPADVAETKVSDSERGRVSPAKAPEQQGVQRSGKAVEEFKPYSPADQTKKDPQVEAAIQQLKSIEEKVKAHEAAHKSAGGAMTGPVSYTYTRGPDGKNYITGGEVPISVTPGKTPQETISRMQQVIQAALAPADPSSQDRAVASQAAAQQQQARQEQSQQLATGSSAVAGTASQMTPPPAAAPEPGKQSDSITARDSQRAYGNPAVTGKQPETPAPAISARKEAQSLAPALAEAVRGALASLTPASITGFDSFQSMSYYA